MRPDTRPLRFTATPATITLASLLLILPFISPSQVLAQIKIRSGRKVVTLTEKLISSPRPVVFGTTNDGLPETMKVRGRISEISFSRACGVVFWSGTIKLKLVDKIPGYPHENLYVVINCLEDSRNEAKYLNKVVEMNVTKLLPRSGLYREGDACYYEFIDNTIKSKGVPFYCSRIWRDELLRQASLDDRN